ncbi:hypothetical protein [Nonomuraea salmonea]|uniref:hypothetical protein n=1 Tax=Nonomuraea salmonea TaxID=46181 RepID=UPI002FE6F9B7
MQDPNQADRQEILSGPGDARLDPRNRPQRNRSTKNNKKATILAASALVALLAAGGAGYLLAGNDGEAAQSGAGPQTSQSPGDDLQGDDDATMGDVTTDEPGDGAKDQAADAPVDDGGVGDVADPGTGGGDPAGTDKSGSKGVNAARGDSGEKTTNGKKPVSSPREVPAVLGQRRHLRQPGRRPRGHGRGPVLQERLLTLPPAPGATLAGSWPARRRLAL